MLKSRSKKEIVLVFTGGTICMRPKSDGCGVVPSGNADQLMTDLAPYVENVGFRPIFWSDLPSPHMTPDHMLRLAKDLDLLLAEPSVQGAVVTHGTDTLVESAFMADLIISSAKPVVFTGAMRFYGETGYDGFRNLLNSIRTCMLPMPIAGVSLLMADRLFVAREVIKVNSLNIAAFEAPGSGPIGYVAGDEIIITRRPGEQTTYKQSCISANSVDPYVPLISCYTGMTADLMEYLRQKKISGLVLEGFGAGNVPPDIVPGIEAIIGDDIPVVLSSRCLEGGVYPVYAYHGGGADLKQKGIIMAGRLSGIKARILLMVALGEGLKLEEIRNSFEYYGNCNE